MVREAESAERARSERSECEGRRDGGPTGADCVHADRCPGCTLIDRPYADQLAHKTRRVRRAFDRHAVLGEMAFDPIAAADPIVGYRRRAKLAIGAGGRIGAFAPGTHEVIDIPECLVLAPPIARAVAALRGLLRSPPDDAREVLARLTALDLRAASGRVLVTLVLDRERTLAPQSLARAGEVVLGAGSDIAGVAVSTGSAKGPTLLGGAPRPIAGAGELVDRTDTAELVAVPGAFAQVHAGQADRVARLVLEHLGAALGGLEGARVLDLYGGSGALGLPLAARGATVTIVESYAPAADAARHASTKFGERVRVLGADATRFLGERVDCDAIVVNPPRRGVTPEARARIAATGATALAYVSCNPETLARDLAHLALFGIVAKRVLPLDMIPLTNEVETVALLARGDIPLPRVIHESSELVVVDKPPHEPTIPQGEHAGSLLARVQRIEGCERAAPVHRLDATMSGVCIFARYPEAAARWSRRWPDAHKTYRALAQGITRRKGVVNRALLEQGKPREARTRFARVEVVRGHSLLDVFPDQGTKHQIRRHLAGLGHPIVGDLRHGHAPTNRHFSEAHGLDRSFLHCARIEIGEHVFEAPLTGDLSAVLDSLRRGA